MSKNRKYMRKPNGYGGIVKLSGNRRKPFCVRITVGFTDEGEQILKPIGYFETRSEAEKFLAVYNADPSKIDTKKYTFEQLFKTFWESKYKYDYDNVPKGYKKSSAERGYVAAYKYCEPIHKKTYSELTKNNFQVIVDKAIEEGYSRSFINNLSKLWNGMYDKYNEIKSRVDGYKFVDTSGLKPKEKRKNVFFHEELEIISKHKHKSLFYDILVFLLYTGTRINEALKTEKKKVCLEERYFVSGSKTEAGKDRIIPIHKKLVPIVKQYMDKPGKYLFTQEDGKVISDYYYRESLWHPFFEKIGLKKDFAFTPHATRHTFISQAKRCGMDELLRKRIVGHSDKDFTDKVYTHTEIRDLVNAIDHFDYEFDLF